MPEWIAVAVVRRPVGLEGFCAIEPFGKTFSSLEPPCSVRIGKESEGAAEAEIAEIVSLPKEYRVRFSGKKDRTSVEGLRGALVFVLEANLPVHPDDEFYHFELKGMEVIGDNVGERLGIVDEVYNFPSVDTIEVKLDGGGTVLLPLSKQAVVEIDRSSKRMVVRQSFLKELLS